MEPLSDTTVHTLAERYASMVSELGLEAGEPLLVLPNSEFFPDRFSFDQASVERLTARMQGYAALESLAIEPVVVGGAEAEASGGCGTGGCGTGACATPAVSADGPRVERVGERFVLRVPAAELQQPIVLTARLATSLGAIALAERHPRGERLAGDPAQAELAAVALGFGVLLLEASYLYSKSCGGPNVQRGTTLECDELAVLLVLASARDGHPLKAALAELATTQRAFVKEAQAIVGASPKLLELLRERPERVARGDFRLREGGSFWARWFGSKPRVSEVDREAAALRALERGASVEELEALVGGQPAARSAKRPAKAAAEDAELRSLVDEALSEVERSREARPGP